MNDWINPPKQVEYLTGFVYRIKEKDTGMIYLGIKRFWKTIKLKPLKGKKRKRKKVIETDWKTYNTSSAIMQEKLLKNPSNYQKKIIRVCISITEMKAYEAYYQLEYYVSGRWDQLYNEVINLRMRIRKEGETSDIKRETTEDIQKICTKVR